MKFLIKKINKSRTTVPFSQSIDTPVCSIENDIETHP